jgi:HEAT repeat protein
MLVLALAPGLEWEGSRARWLREAQAGDADERLAAIHALASLTGSEIDEVIVRALRDDDAAVRIEAAEACATRRLRTCAAPLADWLDDRDPEVRAVAARALGAAGDPVADAAGLSRALGDARPSVRRAAVAGLRALGGAAALRAILGAVADTDPIVRERAARALGEVGAESGERSGAATAVLALARDAAPEVREAALDAIGAIGDSRASAAAMVALDDPAIDVRLAALRALVRVPRAMAVPALEAASRDDDRVGRAALAALAAVSSEVAIAPIVAALSRPSVARSAEDALEARMRSSEASRAEVVSALARAIDDAGAGERAVRLAGSASRLALRASIAGLDDALVRALQTRSDATIVEALGRTGSESALVPVLDALASEDASLRSGALAGLEGLAAAHPLDGRILDPLTLALPRLEPSDRARAVTIGAGAQTDRVNDWLLARLDDPAREARVAALRALRTVAIDRGADRLAALLDDSDAETRSLAALALARRAPDASVLERLAASLEGDAPHDRHAILSALGAIVRGASPSTARSHAVRAIAAALRSDDPELADSAAIAVAASHDAALADDALVLARSSGPTALARALRALAGADREDARALGVSALDAADTAVVLAAYTTLGEIGGAAEAVAIAERSSSRFPASAACSFALARMAATSAVTTPRAATALGTLARSHDPYVRANVAVAAARLGVARVGDASAIDWLASPGSPIVGAAAARWAHAARGSLDAARVDELLARCTTDATQPALARACGAPSLPEGDEVADVIALDAHGHPMASRIVALRLADGTALVTYADARGRVWMEHAPRGTISLDAPESAALIP